MVDGKQPQAAECGPQRQASFLLPPTSVIPHTNSRSLTALERAAWLWQWDSSAADEEHRLAMLLLRWKVDPVAASNELFRVALLPYQAEALLNLFSCPREVFEFYGFDPDLHPKAKVLLPSGHGLGKTRLEALAIWIHKLTRRASKRLVTAPTSDQLTGQLWGEVRKMYRRLSRYWPAIAAEWEILSGSITHADPHWGDWVTVARTARPDKPEGLQGAHAIDDDDEFNDLASLFNDTVDDTPSGGIMVVMEESSGIDDSIREVVEGALSEEGAMLLAAGNATRPDGWFALDIEKPDKYCILPLDCRISDADTIYSLPYRDFGGEIRQIRVRGRVSKTYWQGILAECDGDEEHDRFRVRVRGLKPRSAFEQVIKTHWIDNAFARRPSEEDRRAPGVIGLDFGLTGDKHALAVRQGFAVLDVDDWLPKDTPDEITLDAAERAIEATKQYPQVRFIVGDANGVGRGAMEYLSRHFRKLAGAGGPKVIVIFFNSGEQAHDSLRYYRRRDEMWHKHGRRFFADLRTSCPEVPGLRSELTGPGAHEDAARKIKVESKKDIKRRTGQDSGNKADAVLETLVVDDYALELAAAPAPKKEEPVLPEVFRRHFARIRNQQNAGQFIR